MIRGIPSVGEGRFDGEGLEFGELDREKGGTGKREKKESVDKGLNVGTGSSIENFGIELVLSNLIRNFNV